MPPACGATKDRVDDVLHPVCTRSKNHKGDHVAYGLDENGKDYVIVSWPQEETQ